jgi:3-hydroxyacyl-[acyl-carrier-protein] dehydratase
MSETATPTATTPAATPATTPANTERNIEAIMAQLPHRPPFLLVDRVLEASKDGVKAIKNVSINEPFFVGHFPGKPIMPGVLIIEALAQASMFLLEGEFPAGTIAFLAGIENARFKKPVVPGDQLQLEAQLLYFRRGVGKVKAQAKVNDAIVAEAELIFAVAK